MIPSLLAAFFLGQNGQDPAVPPIGPQSESAVMRYAVDGNGGGNIQHDQGKFVREWADGLCPTGEIYVTRKGRSFLALQGFAGEPHFLRHCDTGEWTFIPGNVAHTDVALQAEWTESGELSQLRTRAMYLAPDGVIADFGSKGMLTEPLFRESKSKILMAVEVTGEADKKGLRLHRRDTKPFSPMFSNDRTIPPAETKAIFLGGMDLMIGNPERLRGYYKLLRKGERVDLAGLEYDLRLHPFHLIGLGCQIVTFKNWTRTLFRVELRAGPAAGKSRALCGFFWLDEKGELQLGHTALPFDLAPVVGFVSPRSEADNGRPWPMFVPPTTFVPTPPEFKPPTEGDGGGGKR